MILSYRLFIVCWGIFTLAVHAKCSNLLGNTSPKEQFEITVDGVVIDKVHKLMWMRCSIGQQIVDGTCSGSATQLKWLDALNKAEQLTFAGFADWRLPNKNELNSIIELSCQMPAINSDIFPATGSISYWTSSPYDDLESHVWTINFYDGTIFAKDANQGIAARFVRSI